MICILQIILSYCFYYLINSMDMERNFWDNIIILNLGYSFVSSHKDAEKSYSLLKHKVSSSSFDHITFSVITINMKLIMFFLKKIRSTREWAFCYKMSPFPIFHWFLISNFLFCKVSTIQRKKNISPIYLLLWYNNYFNILPHLCFLMWFKGNLRHHKLKILSLNTSVYYYKK